MRAHLIPAVLALVLLLPIAGCGSSERFADEHQASIGPVTGSAIALAKNYRLGPDGFGQVKLGMTLNQAMATGQLTRNPIGDGEDCRIAVETGTVPAHGGGVWVSGKYGVVKIEAYPGVSTPQGITLGSSLDDLKRAYPDVAVETDRDMSNGQVVIEMDDHYRSKVPGNPQANYRFFVDTHNHVDAMLLVRTTQDCDAGYFD